jgi:hypothetical protein
LLIRLGFVLRPLSRTRFFITNANSACSCVYICKFQFRPIHPPSRRLSESLARYFSSLSASHVRSLAVSDGGGATAERVV